MGPFHTRVSPVPFPDPGLSVLTHFVGRSSLPVSGYRLLAHGAARFLTKPEVTTEKSGVDSRKSANRAKSPGAAAAALYRGQEGSTAGETVGRLPRPPLVHRTPPSPGVQHQGEGSQGQRADMRECQSLMPSYATVVPHHSVLRGQRQSSSRQPPKASAVFPLEPGKPRA